MFQKVQSSGVKLASLLPVEFRSHEALAELMESKVCPLTSHMLCTVCSQIIDMTSIRSCYRQQNNEGQHLVDHEVARVGRPPTTNKVITNP